MKANASRRRISGLLTLLLRVGVLAIGGSLLSAELAAPVNLDSGWQLQDAAKVSRTGAELAAPDFQPEGWYPATVPGTVLTTLVNNKVHPEPLYGENNRPHLISENLCRTPYWYRVVFTVPEAYAGKKVWLNFDGINYAAEVWVNGQKVGNIRGAFARGIFDITGVVSPGKPAAVAVLVSPQPNPGIPHEHTLAAGMGGNGGISAVDGPTFLCSMGWDWIPAIRDRNTGIWQKVFLSATGPVVVKNPLVTSDLPLPDLQTADIVIQTTVENVTDQPQKGVLKGGFGEVMFQQAVELAPRSSRLISFDRKTTPALQVKHPKLWWPNGYGPQNLHKLHLSFETGGTVSDRQDVTFGIREISYAAPDSENLTLSVNGVRVFCKGGNWGMDEAMKRIPRERLEAQVRMHQLANYTMIRNWVGQSTSETLYELCDKYGILLWDEFFQPNPGDGPNPTDIETYVANVREKILRFRNHPSIALWCGRNEGHPPKNIDDELRKLMAELEPTRLYQPSSTDGRGVHSGGPYRWRRPAEYYDANEPFKTEIGSMSIPTIESIRGMMPERDWENINDDWAEHDMAGGASGGEHYRQVIVGRYGKIANLADFVRKAQLANYEAYRAMYEGRNAKLFRPSTGVLTWMSNPAQPSFVWQLYHHDLEPNAALFAVRKACEPVHIQLNEKKWIPQVINHLPTALAGARARVAIYNLDGSKPYQRDFDVTAAPGAATDLGAIVWPTTLSSVHFVKLELWDAAGKLLSDNFYWRAQPKQENELQDLSKLPVANLTANVKRRTQGGKCFLDVTLHNPGPNIALMAHLQLRGHNSNARILPVFYSDNYVSLLPGETRAITIEVALPDLKGEKPLILLDGWNVGVTAVAARDFAVALNTDAQVDRWPVTGLPIHYCVPQEQFRMNCGGEAVAEFGADSSYSGGGVHASGIEGLDASAMLAGAAEIYQTERWGACWYRFSMKPWPDARAYTVRLHFAETRFDAPGKRIFDVEINERKALERFDIFEAAGGRNIAVVREFAGVTPNDAGNIMIQFRKGSGDEPKICAIEILPPPSPEK